ncbi:MAG: glycosyltransferase family 2 protein [Clostridiaceae bacterium]
MKVSVVIPNYNGEKIIGNCINSVLKQSFTDFELIIIDNDSKDNSVKIIEEKYKDVKLIKNEKNLGFAPAVNQGISEAKGKYVALLNNDTEVDEFWLENLYKVIIKDEEIFSVSSKMIRYFERDKIDDAGDEYTILGWAYKRGDGAHISKYDKNVRIFSTCGGAALYNKEILDKIGYFDEKFFAYLEDVDLSFRAQIFGYKNVYCSDAKVFHMVSASSGSRHNSFKVKLAARNNIYLLFKNMPLGMKILNFPFLLAGTLIKYLFFKRKNLHNEYLEGIKEGFRESKKLNKISFKSINLINYIKIELKLIGNTFKMFYYKLYEKKI